MTVETVYSSSTNTLLIGDRDPILEGYTPTVTSTNICFISSSDRDNGYFTWSGTAWTKQ